MKTFITGLSHCDWLATYLTPTSFCINRPIEQCTEKGVEHMVEVMKDFEVACDPYFALFQDAMIEMFPDARWVIIDTPIQESEIGDSVDPVTVKQEIQGLCGKVQDAIHLSPAHVKTSGVQDLFEIMDLNVDEHWHQLMAGLSIVKKDSTINASAKLAGQLSPIAETANNQEYHALLKEMCAPEPDAYKWLAEAFDLALLIDHVYDGDGAAKATSLRALQNLFAWPQNEFYRKYGVALALAMVSVIDAWTWSNDPKCKSTGAAIQFYTEIPALIAYLIGGYNHVSHYMPRIRELIEKGWEEDCFRDGHDKMGAFQ